MLELFHVIDSTLIHHNLVGGEHKQGTRSGLIDPILNALHPANHPIGLPISTAPIAPNGGERELVVPVWTWAFIKQARMGHDRNTHAHHDLLAQ